MKTFTLFTIVLFMLEHDIAQLDAVPYVLDIIMDTPPNNTVSTASDNPYSSMPTNTECDQFFVVDDFAKCATKIMDANASLYFNSGSMFEQTLHENINAFSRLRLRPRVMRDVAERKMSAKLLGERVAFPVAVAATALHKYAHSAGEVATAKGAEAAKTIMILSAYSCLSMEEVAEEAPGTVLWLQMHIFTDRDITRDFVKRAEEAGFKAIVLTIDFPIVGKRLNEIRQMIDMPSNLTFGNFESYLNKASYSGTKLDYLDSLINPETTWEDFYWLTNITELPVVVKGVLTAEDALQAMKHGASGIIVSNHGGRQLDGVPATIEALPEVVKAVNNCVPVFLDGGIRTGADVFKALALGATAVFVGRPAIWGLASGGEKGVVRVLQILKFELNVTMALTGCKSLNEIHPEMVAYEEYYR